MEELKAFDRMVKEALGRIEPAAARMKSVV
jgi:hypothetical protein